MSLLKTYCVEPESGILPQKLVIILHGYGADGANLIGLGAEWKKGFPHVEFLAPDAPDIWEEGGFGRQWFSLKDRSLTAMGRGVESASKTLNAFIDKMLSLRGLRDSDLVLIGFSQGAMMALYTGLSRPHPCAGIIGYSGLFTHPDTWTPTSKPPILLIHGGRDDVIPSRAMKESEEVLKSIGIDVQSHLIEELDHSICPQGLKLGDAFLKKVLDTQ